MYHDQTFERILQRMLDRTGNNVDKREGSLIWDGTASAAVELQLMYLSLDDLLEETFGDTASREFLIRRVRERGIIPFPATQAVLRGVFTPEHVDVLGRRFSMPNTTMTYRVIAQIEGGYYQVQCEQFGTQGNRFLGTIIPIGGSIIGLQTAELTEILIPANDEENTENIRQRYFNSFDEQAFGGNIRDYQLRTRSIDGIGAVKVTPIWKGGGTVRLTILDAQYNPASEVLINAVQEIIDPTQDHTGIGIAPIGHVVTVTTVTTVPIRVNTEITLVGGVTWGMVEHQVVDLIESYLLELRKDWENQDVISTTGLIENPLIVRISHIDARILALPDIVDIQNTCINEVAENLAVGKYEVPVFAGISI